MTEFNRRKFLEGSAGVAAAATVGSGAAVFAPAVHAQTLTYKAEKDAKLRVLRWLTVDGEAANAVTLNVQ